MAITLMRLKNAPQGAPYAIEQIDGLDPQAAGQLSASWWDSRGTIALIVVHNGEIDSRYLKEYADTERFPDEWPKGDVAPPKPEPLPERLKPVHVRQRPAPTLANPPERKAEKVTCPGCQRQVAEQAKREETSSSSVCSVCGVPFACVTCLKQLPESRRYDGDDDPTPSGRIANHRCPECGSPQPQMSGRQIWNMYTRRRKG